ncbi:FtsK/SpoIIIE domain-containing protein [Psychrobacillus sp. BM2]|uniref:FtsK/SpoIIIE domain-containing protein n=1 Tax=Psychrobacillus sp. BM2 TaxID=3400421 RepID=UPI003B028BF4
MIFEILSTTLFSGIGIAAYMKKGTEKNDSGKIQRIISLSGLNVKDGSTGRTLTTQLIRKKKHPGFFEYKFRIPYGRSYEDYLKKQRILEDGLNNRRKRITVNDLKTLFPLDSNIIENIKDLWTNKLTDKKEIELLYDGLLIVRVYDEPLSTLVPFQTGEDWKIPVGLTREKNTFRYHDFNVIPHIVIGGSSGYGKSSFLNSMIISLLQSQPDNVKFHLIDLKGGVEFSDYENLKQTVSIAYEPEEALATLQQAYETMRDIQSRLRMMGKKNVKEANINERHFVIIDESGELNPAEGIGKADKDLKLQCQTYMSQIARIGRSNGFHQILATQYPVGDVLPRQVKQNSDAKICFRVQSEVASRVVLDSSGGELLPQVVGRAIYQTASKREILQTPLITSEIIHNAITPHIVKKEEIILEKKTIIESRPANLISFERA